MSTINPNPTPTVPVPREVAERLLAIRRMDRDEITEMYVDDERPESSKLEAEQADYDIAALSSALAAPANDGWNYNLDEAPKDSYVLLSVTGTSKCTFFEPQSVCSWWDEVEEQWMSFPRGYHQRHQIIAWRPLPSPAPKPEEGQR